MTELVLHAPLAGWGLPLDEVDDAVFAAQMLGDGVAIDPTEGILRAPCDGVVTALPDSAHAVTIRAAIGAEILLHVGIDTVSLGGRGFEPLVRPGARVRTGDALIRFDLDALARAAKSLVTPVVVTEPDRFRVAERRAPGPLRAGERLLTVRANGGAPAAAEVRGTGDEVTGTVTIELAHGLHARPAAILAQAIRTLAAEVTLSLGERSANGRSAVALLSLGARRGDTLALRARGADASLAGDVLDRALARARTESDGRADTGDGRAPRAASGAAPAIVASPGIGIGPAVRIARREPAVAERGADASTEMARLDEARRRLALRLERLGPPGGARGGVVDAHLEFLDDPELLAAAYRHIAEGKSAGFAWRAAVQGAVRVLGALDDAHLAARADDLRDLELQMLEILAGAVDTPAPELPESAILLARDLLPSQFLALDPTRVAGICTVSPAATSHVAILAGAAGIPMLAGVDAGLLAVADGVTVVVDAEAGRVAVAPAAAEVAEARARIDARARRRARLRAEASRECRTAGGERIEVFANVGSVTEAAAAVDSGAEGCGLLRTEFLFLDRAAPPARAEQAAAYRAIADAFGGRPVVVRTLDAGGDKPIPFLAMPGEDNPALGMRGIRAGLWRTGILREQLAAILSVGAGSDCRILLPMVNDAAEIASVRAMVREVAAELRGRADVPVGVMVETPAAAIDVARLARHADFFSIGTNDLAQYALAIDRTHPLIAGRLDALHPAVLRLVEVACAAARAAGRPVSVCGNLASDPAAAPLLVGLGVGELSAVPGAIPAVKAAVRRATLAGCRALAARALAADDAAAVRALLAEAGGEVDA
jgi:phosphoenolpyruvate-protein phosphotransferase